MLATLFVAMILTSWLTSAGRAAPAPAPTCEAGPVTVGAEIHGTPCDDRIVVPSDVETVEAGGGNDVILPAAIAASDSCPSDGCHLGVGSQTFDGGPGNDVVFGERGNDTLNGGGGDDHLYGGIGDDRLRGGPGDDHLSGGFGADSIDGEGDNDFVRGDPTVDRIADSGGSADTLSYGTGVTPGFSSNPDVYPDFSEYPNFPATVEGRGVYIDLTAGIGDNGVAPDGGGVDEVTGTGFENVVGTAFSDFIVGTSAGETIYGGGGADVIFGEGGDDRIYGGADGDHLDGGSGQDTIDGGSGTDSCEGCEPANPCETNGRAVVLRDASKIAVGVMAPEESAAELYLAGSDVDDLVTATYSPASPPTVTFQLEAGSVGAFDSSPSVAGGCGAPAADKVVCALAEAPDSIVLAGMAGNDSSRCGRLPGFDLDRRARRQWRRLPDRRRAGTKTCSATGRETTCWTPSAATTRFSTTKAPTLWTPALGSDLLLSDSHLRQRQAERRRIGDNRDNASWTKLKRAGGGPARHRRRRPPRAAGSRAARAAARWTSLAERSRISRGRAKDDFFRGDVREQPAARASGRRQLLRAARRRHDPCQLRRLRCRRSTAAKAATRPSSTIPTPTYADPAPGRLRERSTKRLAERASSRPGRRIGPPPPAPRAARRRRRTAHAAGSKAAADQAAPRAGQGGLHAGGRWRRVAFAFGSNEVRHRPSAASSTAIRFKPCRSPRALPPAPRPPRLRTFTRSTRRATATAARPSFQFRGPPPLAAAGAEAAVAAGGLAQAPRPRPARQARPARSRAERSGRQARPGRSRPDRCSAAAPGLRRGSRSRSARGC